MKRALAIIFFFLSSVILINHPVFSETTGDKYNALGEEIVELEQKLDELTKKKTTLASQISYCLLYTSPSPRDRQRSRMPSSA